MCSSDRFHQKSLDIPYRMKRPQSLTSTPLLSTITLQSALHACCYVIRVLLVEIGLSLACCFFNGTLSTYNTFHFLLPFWKLSSSLFDPCVMHSKDNLVPNHVTLVSLKITLCRFRSHIRDPLVDWIPLLTPCSTLYV